MSDFKSDFRIDMTHRTSLEVAYQNAVTIYGKSIGRIEVVSESTEDNGLNSYNIYRDDGLLLGTINTYNGSRGTKNITIEELDGIRNDEKGIPNGVATLDEAGKIPVGQLPSYVDDVLEFNNLSSFPAVGEPSKIYVDKDKNLTYRWGGSSYVEISKSLALGETSSTAYAGDKGKTVADTLSSHTGNAYIHVTQENKDAWNAKYDKPTSGIPKSALANDIKNSLALADSALQEEDLTTYASHVANTTVHVTSSDKSNWNSKADYSSVYKKSETYTKSEVNGLVQSARPDDYETVKGQVGANTTDISTLKTDVQALKDEPSVPEGVVTFDEGELGVATDPYVTEGELADRLDERVRYSNRNLLDNGWFTVNQRGQTTYTTDRLIYTVDRWISSSTVSISANGVTLPTGCYFLQKIDDFEKFQSESKTYTLSVMVDSGTVFVGSFDSHTVDSIIIFDNANIRAYYSLSDGGITLLTHLPITIKAVKLELGDKSTLQYDSAPNYAEELLKCQRYFVRMKFNPCGVIFVQNGDTRCQRIMFPTEMRIVPTVEKHNTLFFIVGISPEANHTNLQISEYNIANDQYGFSINYTKTPMEGQGIIISFGSSNVLTVDFKADL